MPASFDLIKQGLGYSLVSYGVPVRVPNWQSLDVRDKPMGETIELRNQVFEASIPGHNLPETAQVTGANLPWAEDHFQERVSGVPYNPPPSAAYWPYQQGGHKAHTQKTKFSHTYPERFCGRALDQPRPKGLRDSYGSFEDVVEQLRENPHTRQAYLPIWYPEDTGHGAKYRVPCTLGYHFLIREGKLTITYFIRSVDFLRHFSDDVYMAMRLAQRVASRLEPHHRVVPTALVMHIVSLHVFSGDMPRMRKEYSTWRRMSG